jgi:hypothetical protein
VQTLNPTALTPVYYDLQGRVVEKCFNQLLIEQIGSSRKKVIIQN